MQYVTRFESPPAEVRWGWIRDRETETETNWASRCIKFCWVTWQNTICQPIYQKSRSLSQLTLDLRIVLRFCRLQVRNSSVFCTNWRQSLWNPVWNRISPLRWMNDFWIKQWIFNNDYVFFYLSCIFLTGAANRSGNRLHDSLDKWHQQCWRR